MDERNSKRDLVLAPSEYAYMQDVTKGVVKTYTGPTVINPTAQERPVVFNPDTKRFEPCTLEQAVQQIAIAPEGYYVVLKNPSARNDHPRRAACIPGPIWTSAARSTSPDRVRSRCGPARSSNSSRATTCAPTSTCSSASTTRKRPARTGARRSSSPPSRVRPSHRGRRSPTRRKTSRWASCSSSRARTCRSTSRRRAWGGHDESGSYVRDALTLERLEYCILVDQNGKKRYERGPKVVFPEPTETFIVKEGYRKFRALELNEIQGLHVKVIAPYTEGGRAAKRVTSSSSPARRRRSTSRARSTPSCATTAVTSTSPSPCPPARRAT
jgi:major vault protein